ncbi:MAG: hypothetical protein U9R50_10050 [Campylobacterota bacterium]|nr:hypothetical protein [Campylobacterota bacterium]
MQHLIELLSNPWIITLIVIIFFGEYLPFTKTLWQKMGALFHAFAQWFIQNYENRLYSKKDAKITDKKVYLKLNNIFARIIFFAISTVIVIFLEIFWELGFKGITRFLERSSFALYSEKAIKQLPSWAVLILFSLPFIFMELLGIFALGAFVAGQFWFGVGLYIVKVLFFIPVHFILHVGREKLLAIAWFKRRYEMITATLEWFKTSQTYIKVHNISQTIKAYVDAIKQMFTRSITLLKKAFNHTDTLSPECEEIRQEILARKEKNLSTHTLYEKFFNCLDSHLQESKKRS